MSSPDPLSMEALERVHVGLTAAGQLDRAAYYQQRTPANAAAHAYDLGQVTEAAEIAREVVDALDEGVDALAWALHTHGGLSHTQVAQTLGYGRVGGRRSVGQVQTRINRERRRRAATLAALLAAAPGAPVQIPDPPRRVDPDAHAEAAAAVLRAAAAEAGDPDPVVTTEAVDALARLWGSAAGELLPALEARAQEALARFLGRAAALEAQAATDANGQPR